MLKDNFLQFIENKKTQAQEFNDSGNGGSIQQNSSSGKEKAKKSSIMEALKAQLFIPKDQMEDQPKLSLNKEKVYEKLRKLRGGVLPRQYFDSRGNPKEIESLVGSAFDSDENEFWDQYKFEVTQPQCSEVSEELHLLLDRDTSIDKLRGFDATLIDSPSAIRSTRKSPIGLREESPINSGSSFSSGYSVQRTDQWEHEDTKNFLKIEHLRDICFFKILNEKLRLPMPQGDLKHGKYSVDDIIKISQSLMREYQKTKNRRISSRVIDQICREYQNALNASFFEILQFLQISGYLHAKNYHLSGSQLTSIAVTIPYILNLRYINLENTGMSDKEFTQILKACHDLPKLQELYLGQNRMGTESVRMLNHPAFHKRVKLLSLQGLVKSSVFLITALDKLLPFKQLRTLDLSHNKLCLQAVKAIGGLLQKEKCPVTTLGLSDCFSQGVYAQIRVLFQYLNENTSLVDVDLSRNHFRSCEKEAGSLIGRMIQLNQSIVHLNVEECGLSYEEVLYICIILQTNHTLSGLHLSFNSFTFLQKCFIIDLINHDNEYQYITPGEKELKSKGMVQGDMDQDVSQNDFVRGGLLVNNRQKLTIQRLSFKMFIQTREIQAIRKLQRQQTMPASNSDLAYEVKQVWQECSDIARTCLFCSRLYMYSNTIQLDQEMSLDLAIEDVKPKILENQTDKYELSPERREFKDGDMKINEILTSLRDNELTARSTFIIGNSGIPSLNHSCTSSLEESQLKRIRHVLGESGVFKEGSIQTHLKNLRKALPSKHAKLQNNYDFHKFHQGQHLVPLFSQNSNKKEELLTAAITKGVLLHSSGIQQAPYSTQSMQKNVISTFSELKTLRNQVESEIVDVNGVRLKELELKEDVLSFTDSSDDECLKQLIDQKINDSSLHPNLRHVISKRKDDYEMIRSKMLVQTVQRGTFRISGMGQTQQNNRPKTQQLGNYGRFRNRQEAFSTQPRREFQESILEKITDQDEKDVMGESIPTNRNEPLSKQVSQLTDRKEEIQSELIPSDCRSHRPNDKKESIQADQTIIQSETRATTAIQIPCFDPCLSSTSKPNTGTENKIQRNKKSRRIHTKELKSSILSQSIEAGDLISLQQVKGEMEKEHEIFNKKKEIYFNQNQSNLDYIEEQKTILRNQEIVQRQIVSEQMARRRKIRNKTLFIGQTHHFHPLQLKSSNFNKQKAIDMLLPRSNHRKSILLPDLSETATISPGEYLIRRTKVKTTHPSGLLVKKLEQRGDQIGKSLQSEGESKEQTSPFPMGQGGLLMQAGIIIQIQEKVREQQSIQKTNQVKLKRKLSPISSVKEKQKSPAKRGQSMLKGEGSVKQRR